jgi:hypothetical protein
MKVQQLDWNGRGRRGGGSLKNETKAVVEEMLL